MRHHLSGQGVRRIAGIVLAALLGISGSAIGGTNARPEKWAKPVASAVLLNWYKLDDGVYRSRQPDRRGFEEAKREGIRTIIDLRAGHSDAKLVEGLGLNLVEIPLRASEFSEEEIIGALRAIQESPKPVLVHCQHGSDRTGVVSAAYRVLYHGWTKEEAIAELKEGGFGFHRLYTNIPTFIRRMDVARIRSLLSSNGPRRSYSPPIWRSRTRNVGAAIDKPRSRSSAAMSMPLRISSAVPAIGRPLTGKAILPFSTQNPDAPPLKLPLTGLIP